MAVLNVVAVPHPTLREKALPVTEFTPELKEFASDMVETMYDYQGVGLAANQVDSLQRVVVADCSEERNQPHIFINPEIIAKSEEEEEAEEGCLSLPTLTGGPVPRAAKITVRAQDVEGEFFEMELDGLWARCIQHEIDHLEGVLFIDYLSRLKQERILKKLERVLREQARD